MPESPTSISPAESIELELLHDDEKEHSRHVSKVETSLLDLFSEDLLDTLPRRYSSKSLFSKTPSPAPPLAIETPSQHAYPCASIPSSLPPPPAQWPQRPLTIHPTPNTGTKIRGVRRSSSKEYIDLKGFCAGCTLPLNTGREKRGDALVIDFESDLFIGTALFRVKDCVPVTGGGGGNSDDKDSYFGNRHRSFQAVIKGRFRRPDVAMSRVVTGQYFRRPPGKLPPSIVLKGAIKLISTLAPQLDARLNKVGSSRFVSPMLSAAQVVLVGEGRGADGEGRGSDEELYRFYPGADDGIEEFDLTEPVRKEDSSIVKALPANSIKTKTSSLWKKSVSDVKFRKKAFDALHKKKLMQPTFDTAKEYTFEFYSHLLSINDMTLDLGSLGKYSLKDILNGQPVKCPAGVTGDEGEELEWLWSFDIWHESVYETALEFEQEDNS